MELAATSQRGFSSASGFTRTDLIVAAGTLLLLATIQAGVHNRSNLFGNTLECQSNLRILGKGWLQFAQDHSGYLPGNSDTTSASGNWAGGWMTFQSEESADTSVVVEGNQLARYVDDPAVYRCPSDASMVLVGRDQVPTPRARSYSANHAAGTQADGRTPVEGEWLDGIPSHTLYETYRTFGNLSHMVAPSPSGLFLVVDEHPDSINDATLFATMNKGRQARIVDYPASYHGNGANFVFADGHVETHRWKDRRTTPPVAYTGQIPLNVGSPDNPDMEWLADHTSSEIP